MSQRRIEFPAPPDVAWPCLKAAFATIGKIEESNESTRSLIGKASYGLNPVRMRVSVLSGPSGDSAVFDIQARGQDVWGKASRTVIDRLAAALEADAQKARTDARESSMATSADGAHAISDELSRLGELHRTGTIDDQEFAAAKAKLLSQ
jgi:hypothetical protein